ncbi:MAG: tetraacyldisaccharide 4'-kinase, partial [Alphaproteobacteria bacterium]|nr:tetraacyldisaccharide 4'-kinase [Alphaproteobacteria bacterium]
GAYALAARARQRKPGWTAPVPVICVGNLVAGGAGKTPVALAIQHYLNDRGLAAHFLSRGHGGRLSGPLRVDPDRHSAADVGDEPLLLAAQAPAWIARDRAAGAKAAIEAGAPALILDDGFQNPGLEKTVSLIVVDGGYGFGNGRVLPAGPLREPVEDGLARAQAVVLVGEDATGTAESLAGRLPVLTARLEPLAGQALEGRRLLAFAGIGRPEKFFATLRQNDAVLVEAIAYPDHHPYDPAEIDRLARRARSQGAAPITTRKDWVRLPPEQKRQIEVLDIQLVWDDPDGLTPLFDSLLLT